MKTETQDRLSTVVAPLFGDKSSHPSREGKVAGLKELFNGKPHRQPADPLCRALGTQLSLVRMGNASSVSAQGWKQPVRLKGRGLPASVSETPCISHLA